ncbi:MAG TPA: site-specific integrase, partial [Nevskiaceae bacterium]|nr:site-specific integrase [Nevskiaceae bacterium]
AQPRDRPLSAQTVNHITGLLNMIMTEASIRYGFPNPCTAMKRLKLRRGDIEPFTLQEAKKIIAAVREDFRNYFTLRFFTGMRTGELHGLKWSHIDYERRQILVRETFAKGRTDYTKTDGSQRDIDMSGVVMQALKAQELLTKSRSEYVFCTRAGTPLDEKNVTDRVWYPLLRHLQLKKRRPYQCRHTCATFWLASGENPEWIARQMGHTTTEMLFRTYSRYVPNLTRKDGSAFDRMLEAAMVQAPQ